MITPPRRTPAATQIAARVRVGIDCGAAAADSVEETEAEDKEPVIGRDELLPSND